MPLAPLVPLAFSGARSFFSKLGDIGTNPESDRIVAEQNRFHREVLAPVVDAKDNPSTPIEDLLEWRDVLWDQGTQFLDWVSQFAGSGPGAIRTIFGVRAADGEWMTTSEAPGYATQILRDLNRIIEERTGMPQLGFDWSRLAQIGVEAAAAITNSPIGVTVGNTGVTATPATRYYTTDVGVGNLRLPDSVPGWVWPVGIGVVAAVLLSRRR